MAPRPTVGRLAWSQRRQEWAFSIRGPVMRNGQLRYVLTAVIPPQALGDVVTHQQPAEEGEFTRTLVDSQGTIAFRTRSPDRFIGTPTTPRLRERTRASTEGVFRGVTLEGTPSYVAFSRSLASGWISSVVVPVEVSIRRLELQAELRVRDRGPGIAPADQERIFHKFERAVEGRAVSGLGLGLFIVREIVEMHGGAIHVESALGEGATFVVVLPVQALAVLEDVSKEPSG